MTVSIIIPVYRSQDYIEKCVRSVFNQTYKDFYGVENDVLTVTDPDEEMEQSQQN